MPVGLYARLYRRGELDAWAPRLGLTRNRVVRGDPASEDDLALDLLVHDLLERSDDAVKLGMLFEL